jgi:magnesium and cobalt transporter
LRRHLHFYPESKRVGELLLEMRRRGEEIAAVVDEHGAFDGIVSMEDAAEQVVGEIVDLHDLERFRVQELTNGDLLVSAQLEMDLCNAILGTDLQDEDVETLGGLVCKRLGRIPAVGESVDFGGWRFTVAQAAPNRVQRLRLRRLHGGVAMRHRRPGGRS